MLVLMLQDACTGTTRHLYWHYKGACRHTTCCIELMRCKQTVAKRVYRTFSLSQMNNVELARTLSWRENALFEERKRAKSFPLYFPVFQV